jgi:hypothetical protein
LTGSKRPSYYWNVAKKNIHLYSDGTLPILKNLKLLSLNGKSYSFKCTNTEGVVRILMEIPSPKAENVMIFLAKNR